MRASLCVPHRMPTQALAPKRRIGVPATPGPVACDQPACCFCVILHTVQARDDDEDELIPSRARKAKAKGGRNMFDDI